jgi:hypothetical protein
MVFANQTQGRAITIGVSVRKSAFYGLLRDALARWMCTVRNEATGLGCDFAWTCVSRL